MGKRRTPEGLVKKAIIDYLKLQKGISIFPVSTMGVFDLSAGRFRKTAGRRGTPDIILCFYSRFVGLEVKPKGGMPTKEQVEVGQDIIDCGGTWAVVRSIEDVQRVLASIVLKN